MKRLLFVVWIAYANLSWGRVRDPLVEADRLREAIEIRSSDVFDWFPLQARETYQLKVDPVYHQGSTMFCWAYAALHTLRTFYYGDESADPTWTDFIRGIDSRPKYQQYVVSQVGHTGEAGWPIEAVYFYEKSIGSPSNQKWVSLVPSSTKEGWYPHPPPDLHSYTPQAYYLPQAKMIEKMRNGFQAGAPTAFCTHLHCVTIYGATYENGVPVQYKIADSGNGTTYTASANKVHATIADVMVLEKDSD
jgi:hypothetical protein